MRTIYGTVLCTLFALTACCTQGKNPSADPAGSAAKPRVSYAGTIQAPEFPTGLDWLNTARPLTLKSLRGKVVVLDFWTYGCINCFHDFPWLLKLERDFPDTLVVIGVHSAKFSEEGNTRNIREVILRYGLDYPVVNDSQFKVWNQWNVQAWPTLEIIDPAGNVVGYRAGEGFYPLFKKVIGSLVAEFAAKGLIDRRPISLRLEKEGLPQTLLSFPGKVHADPRGNRIFIADTDHNRIIVAALDSGDVTSVIGSGVPGLQDGSYSTAEFNHEQGLALSPDGDTLYVADTVNHAIRRVDLEKQTVRTIAGTGEQAALYPPPGGSDATKVALSSPWDLALSGNWLYIAMAGCHQIWRMPLDGKGIYPYAGSGDEGTDDGPLARASLAQPSGITVGPDGRIYFASSEGSSIRMIDPAKGTVATIAGSSSSLFDFGDKDGIGRAARLQHPLGVVAYRGKLYVADTYNNKIKVVDPITGEVRTLAGGAAGWRDGAQPLFYEPGGIDAAGGKLYIADTNNHSIRILDLSTGLTSTLALKGISLLDRGDVYLGKTVRLGAVSVAPGRGTLRLQVSFPPGFSPNAEAPSAVTVSSAGAVSFPSTAAFNAPGPRFPMDFPAVFSPGTSVVTVDLSVVYCREVESSVCLIEQARLVVPVSVVASARSQAPPVLKVSYDVDRTAAGGSPQLGGIQP